jgi:hypothetical protein
MGNATLKGFDISENSKSCDVLKYICKVIDSPYIKK